MKNINTLIPDIHEMLKGKENWINDEVASKIAGGLTKGIVHSNSQRDEGFKPSLRLSQMGPRCPCALWHSIHTPELGEKLPPAAIIKYTYGHIIEALVIEMARAAGHEVTGEQDELVVDGVKGHRDCVIDGCIVDVKSAASRSFQKFRDKSIKDNDTFGYLDQLDGYIVGSLSDDLVRVKDRGYLLAVDKTLGHMALYEHQLREDNIKRRIREYRNIIDLPSAPKCTCGTVADGASGNIRLDTKASYSSYKYCCFPNLRTFIYSDGPRYLTKVVRRPAPHVVELDKNGRIVYGLPST